MLATTQGSEFYMLSESVQKNGQLAGAIFTHLWISAIVRDGRYFVHQERLGTIVNSRSAAIRSASGGCVLNSEDKVPLPNHGFTIHSAAVDGETLVVRMRWL